MCGISFPVRPHFVIRDTTLDWSSRWSTVGHVVFTFSSRSSWLTQTLSRPHSLSSLPRSRKHTHEYKMAEILRQQALAEMTIITVHLLSIPTQSEVIQKALSELTSCPLESPSSFFCWLQLSVTVWARCRLITPPVSNEPIFHVYPRRGDVSGRCHSKTGWTLNVIHFLSECRTPCAENQLRSIPVPFSVQHFKWLLLYMFFRPLHLLCLVVRKWSFRRKCVYLSNHWCTHTHTLCPLATNSTFDAGLLIA